MQRHLWQRQHWIGAALVLATLFAFEPVRNNGFISLDDGLYITENPHVRHGLSANELSWAFNVGYASNWHPLTWLSHMLDVSLWGMDAGAHHLASVVLHAASVLVLFSLMRRMTGATAKSALVAAAFAVHPLHVESVAWASERKDVLSTLLGLLSLWTWVAWTQKGGTARYAGAIALYALGLAAKPMLVSLPFLLLLLDFWPLRRIARAARPGHAGAESSATSAGRTPGALVREKIPFFVLAGVSCAITVAAQREAIVAVTTLSLPFRFGNAFCACVDYVAKALWPAGLAILYPYPEVLSATKVILGAAFLLGSTAVVVREARRRPWLAVGWLWWLGMLVPVLGIVQVGRQSMADRYMYLPLVGLSIVLVWGADEILSRWKSARVASVALAVSITVAWVVLTRAQAARWKDDFSVFGRALAVTEKNHGAHDGFGIALLELGRLDEALIEFHRALAISPDNPKYESNLGVVLEKQGRLEQAIEAYREALEFDPDMPVAQGNLANLLEVTDRFDEAIPHYEKLLILASDKAQAHNDYGVALAKHDRFEASLKQFSAALRYRPDYGDAYLNQGITLVGMGLLPEAIESLNQGLRLRPDRTDVKALLDEVRAAQTQAEPASDPR